MWCVIPVAGRGTRLDPLTQERPKALVQIGGCHLITRLIEQLAGVVTDVCLVVGESGRAIRAVLGTRRAGLNLSYVLQPEPLGVADAVARGREYVTGPFAVVMGDTYYSEPLGPYIEDWRVSGAEGAVLVEPITGASAESVGLVRVKDQRVTWIAKTALSAQAQYRVCGLMAFPETAFEAFAKVGRGSEGERELEDVVLWLIEHGAEFRALRYGGWRRNINTLADLHEVKRRIAAVGHQWLSTRD